MTAREFLTNITIILTVMAIGALIETAVPMFVAKTWTRDRRGANLGLTALAFLFNWLLASVAAIAALTLGPTGVLARLGWSRWVDLVVGIVVLDFAVGYLSRLLGTYTRSSRAESVVYGLDDAGRMSTASCPGLVLMPFQRPQESGLPDTKVRLATSGDR